MKKRKVFYFYAKWCSASVTQLDMVMNVCNKHNVDFEAIDVETRTGVNLSVNMVVRNVPTIVVTKNEREIKRIKGNYGFKELDGYLN